MSRGKPASFTPYFTETDAHQVRAAFLATGQTEGHASVSELIESAVLTEVRRLQRKYHGGMPWEPAPAGSLRPGQRTRGEHHG